MKKLQPKRDEILSAICPSIPTEVFVFDSLASTNTEAKRYCKDGGRLPALFVASEQTEGRGRLGRSFDSERGGLYMTLAVIPDPGATPHSLTLGMGAAVRRAIEDASGAAPRIKWVNDIMIEDKKVAGILAEGSLSASGDMEYAVIGVGVNLAKRRFPEELSEIAGSVEELTGALPEINSLIASIALEFFKLSSDKESMLSEYRSYSYTLGKRVAVMSGGGVYEAIAKEIDSDGNLIVLKDDGAEEKIFFGEISVKNPK